MTTAEAFQQFRDSLIACWRAFERAVTEFGRLLRERPRDTIRAILFLYAAGLIVGVWLISVCTLADSAPGLAALMLALPLLILAAKL